MDVEECAEAAAGDVLSFYLGAQAVAGVGFDGDYGSEAGVGAGSGFDFETAGFVDALVCWLCVDSATAAVDDRFPVGLGGER